MISILGVLILSSVAAHADQTLMNCDTKYDSLVLTMSTSGYQFTRDAMTDRHLGQGPDGHLTGQAYVTRDAELDDVTSVQKMTNGLVFKFNDGKSLTVNFAKGNNGTEVKFTSDIDGLATRLSSILSLEDGNKLSFDSCTLN